MRHAGVLAAASVAALPLRLWAQVPLGDEFQVNTHTTNSQKYPTIGSDQAGNFVVVWQDGDAPSSGQDGHYGGIYAQRYDAGGAPVGGEFRVNAYTTQDQSQPAVASDAAGRFVVTWRRWSDGHYWGIFGQRFSSTGSPVGLEFLVNSHTTGQQGRPSVAADASGNFVAAWNSPEQDGMFASVAARRFDASGAALGADFVVNAFTTSGQGHPRVASAPDGAFVVVWTGAGSGDDYGVFARRYDSSGSAIGGDFRVNDYTTNLQRAPSVALDGDGAFVVSWESYSQDGHRWGVFARRFDPSGNAIGREMRVNAFTPGDQATPSVSVGGDGAFVFAWSGLGLEGGFNTIWGRFAPDGIPSGPDFRVSSYTAGANYLPVLASQADGAFVVAWQNQGKDGSSLGVFARRFLPDRIFEDTFETGSLSRWSAQATGTGDLDAAPAAALGGSGFGLAAAVDDTEALFVEDRSPDDEPRYRGRFYFDPNGFDPGEGGGRFRVRIFIAFQEAPVRRPLALVLRRQSGQYAIQARVRRDDGTRAVTPFAPLTDAPHVVQFDWKRATAPGAADGSLQLWIDGLEAGTLSGLDNDQADVDFARLGALAVKPGASGTLHWDAFETRRLSYIEGPTLTLHLWNEVSSGNATDHFEALLDGSPLFRASEGDARYQAGYTPVAIDVGALAGVPRQLALHAVTSSPDTPTSFHVDDVSLTCPFEPQAVVDPGFEQGTPNPSWAESSTQFGTPLCSLGLCGGPGPRGGTWWAWFGGTIGFEDALLTQTVAVPACP
jgi:hypothetical protein